MFTLVSTFKLLNQRPVSWRLMTVKWRQFSQSNCHSTVGTRQSEYHKALPLLANVQSHLTSSFTDDGNASWYSVCQVPTDCENCRHLTVVGLYDTGPRCFHTFLASKHHWLLLSSSTITDLSWGHQVRTKQNCLLHCTFLNWSGWNLKWCWKLFKWNTLILLLSKIW